MLVATRTYLCGQTGRQVCVAQHLGAIRQLHHFVGLRVLDIAAHLRRKVNQHRAWKEAMGGEVGRLGCGLRHHYDE